MVEELKIKSVASTASKVSDIPIKETTTTRLLFRPLIVDNRENADACVKGSLIYQKKDKNGNFKEDDKAFGFVNVKEGQYCQFDFKSEEILILLNNFDMLKKLYKEKGIINGETSCIITDGNLIEIFKQLSEFKDKTKLSNALNTLQSIDLDNLSFMVSLSKIDKVLQDWEQNKKNSTESYWQDKFKENSWVLSQIFACPYIYINETPYVGGKSIENRGGVRSDYLMKQENSNNIAFVEIKTPTNDLLKNSLYRGDRDEDRNAIYSLSDDLSGAINQILNQRDVFLEKKIAAEGDARDYKNPKCVVIIGNSETLSSGKKKNFDLFRHNIPNIEIITFDELFSRIKLLREVFHE